MLSPPALGSSWGLHWCASGWSFLAFNDAEPIWCNALLQKARWRSSEGMFVQARQRDGRLVVSWLADAHREHVRQYASWKGNGLIPVMAKQTIRLVSVRDGATTFLNLQDVQTCLDFQCGYVAYSKNRHNWEKLMKRFDVPASFILIPSRGTTTATVVVEAFYSSPYALVLILLNCVTNMKSSVDRDRCRCCLRGTRENILIDTTVFVQVGSMQTPLCPCTAEEKVAVIGHCGTCMG